MGQEGTRIRSSISDKLIFISTGDGVICFKNTYNARRRNKIRLRLVYGCNKNIIKKANLCTRGFSLSLCPRFTIIAQHLARKANFRAQ